MILRPRQKTFVERCGKALREHGNTLGIAPTGAGKTIMLSAITGGQLKQSHGKACILAHRDELTDQNRDKFSRVNPGLTSSVVDARGKDWSGQAVFAMVPTLSRETNLEAMPPLDLLVIDEAHHAAAESYRRIVDKARDRNPDLKLLGVTATPNRGDRKALRPVFSNVGDQIRLAELIRSGHLVKPRTFAIDVGVGDDLAQVEQRGGDYDMGAVERVMNRAPVTDQVIRHWKEKAGDRQTVVFCSTVSHAHATAEAFAAAGIRTATITGAMPEAERREALAAYDRGEVQVVVNVAVLTEGWDHPPTSCVVLLRPSSFKSTMVQMIGRGLRTVNPEDYPGIVKTDCIVLDFGISTQLHGSLEQDVDLDGSEAEGYAPSKECPDCGAFVPLASRECALCGHLFESAGEQAAAAPLREFVMNEIDLLGRSSFEWVDLFNSGEALMATGFEAWAGAFGLDGVFYAVGGRKGYPARLLTIGDRLLCLAAADDWLNTHESEETAHKSRSWLSQPATTAQLKYLPAELRHDFSLTRYRASALLSFTFNQGQIISLIEAAAQQPQAA